MTACIACGHPIRDHAPGGCTHPKSDDSICPCELSGRVYSRAEVLAFGERVADAMKFDHVEIRHRNGVVEKFVPRWNIDLAALLDEEGT